MGGVILPGVTIGENCIIAAKSVVTGNVPANQVWGGIPARFIKTIDQYYEDNKKDIIYTHGMNESEKKHYLLSMFDRKRANI